MKATEIREILKQYDIVLREIHPNIDIPGNPDKVAFRSVVEDSNGNHFLFEKLKRGTLSRKKEIINILNRLNKSNQSKIITYIPTTDNKYISYHKDEYYQLSEYIQGAILKRPEYVSEKWRGEVMAKFLIELRKKADITGKKFDLPNYIQNLIRQIQKHNPSIYEQVKLFASSLETFFNDYDKLQFAFCHGDFHPLNMIWGDSEIKAVIDWERCGIKPEMYDIALLIGCIGMEDPKVLGGSLIRSFLNEIKNSTMIKGWDYLFEQVVAIRFGWLAEWLAMQETEFIILELDYMQLLQDNRDELKKIWLKKP